MKEIPVKTDVLTRIAKFNEGRDPDRLALKFAALRHDFGTREKLPTPTYQKLTRKAALALQLLRLTATRHSRVE